jgi:hypothetical protein
MTVQITVDVGLSVGSVHAILKEYLGICHVCAKFVPQLLSDDQIESRKTIAGDLFEQLVQDPSFFGKVGMRVGCLCMTLRQRSSHPNGTQARPHVPRSPEQQNPTSRSCWWHFSMMKE